MLCDEYTVFTKEEQVITTKSRPQVLTIERVHSAGHRIYVQYICLLLHLRKHCYTVMNNVIYVLPP